MCQPSSKPIMAAHGNLLLNAGEHATQFFLSTSYLHRQLKLSLDIYILQLLIAFLSPQVDPEIQALVDDEPCRLVAPMSSTRSFAVFLSSSSDLVVAFVDIKEPKAKYFLPPMNRLMLHLLKKQGKVTPSRS